MGAEGKALQSECTCALLEQADRMRIELSDDQAERLARAVIETYLNLPRTEPRRPMFQ